MKEFDRGLVWAFSVGVALCLGIGVWAFHVLTEEVTVPPMPMGSRELAVESLTQAERALQGLRLFELNPSDPSDPQDVPELMSKEEARRFRKARTLIKRRLVPISPYAITAMVSGIDEMGAITLHWLESDGDTAGVILRERSDGDTTTVEEEYPVFLCPSEEHLKPTKFARPARQIGFNIGRADKLPEDSLEHQGFVLRWRAAGQTKDEEYWRTYTAADREERKTMRKPVMWISRPNGRKVSIVIYDKAGNRSVPVEVVEMGENNTWLR